MKKSVDDFSLRMNIIPGANDDFFPYFLSNVLYVACLHGRVILFGWTFAKVCEGMSLTRYEPSSYHHKTALGYVTLINQDDHRKYKHILESLENENNK